MKHKLFKHKIAFILIWGIVISMLSGCGNREIAFTTGLTRNELFKVDGNVCTIDEAKIVLFNLQREYEGLFGSSNWDSKFAQNTIGDYVKEQAVKQLSQIKSLSVLADNEGIKLSKEELVLVENASKEYLNNIDIKVRESLNIKKKAVENIYKEYCLANKFYEKMIASVDSEISDDEARIISLQYIFFSTKKTDENGKRVNISEYERNELNSKILSIIEKINSGEEFEKLAADNSDDKEIFMKIGRDDVSEEFEKEAFNLTDNQVSGMVNTDEGIYIIKCISNYDEDATLENKKKMYRKRCEDALNLAYDSYFSTVLSEFNQNAWNKVDLVDDENISQLPDLFAVYSYYLPQCTIEFK